MTKEQLTTIIYEAFHKYHTTMVEKMSDFRIAHRIEMSEDLQDDFANAESILLDMEDKDRLYEHLKVFTKKEILSFIALTGCYTMLISVVYDSIRINTQIDDTEKKAHAINVNVFCHTLG